MNQPVSPSISARAGSAVPAAITFAQTTELRRLYGELPNAAAAARKALKMHSGESLTGDALDLFRESDARVVAIVDRIKAILA